MQDGRPAVCLPDPILDACVRPFHDRTLVNVGGPHSRPNSITDVNGGLMDGFIQAAVDSVRIACAADRTDPACLDDLGPRGQPDVMGYHTAREIPNYWTYARAFVLQDHIFGPTDSWTLPAHLYLVSGWSATCTDAFDPMSCRSDVILSGAVDQQRRGAHPPVYAWTDITWLLTRNDVSWAYYVGNDTCMSEADPCPRHSNRGTPPPQNPLPAFTTVHE